MTQDNFQKLVLEKLGKLEEFVAEQRESSRKQEWNDQSQKTHLRYATSLLEHQALDYLRVISRGLKVLVQRSQLRDRKLR